MNYSPASQSKIQVNMGQIRAGGILMGVGGALALAGAAVAGTALMAAFRQRVQQMDVPPSEAARLKLAQAKAAAQAGASAWQDGPATAARSR